MTSREKRKDEDKDVIEYGKIEEFQIKRVCVVFNLQLIIGYKIIQMQTKLSDTIQVKSTKYTNKLIYRLRNQSEFGYFNETKKEYVRSICNRRIC